MTQMQSLQPKSTTNSEYLLNTFTFYWLMEKTGRKWANSLFVQKNKCFAQFPKLIKEMPFFYNVIFSKSSFNVKLDL